MGSAGADTAPAVSDDLSGSHRQILRATSIIGGSSVVNVLIGLVRLKLAALLLGPVGVGLAGLLQSLMNTGSTVAALGFGTAGTRQIAEANTKDEGALRAVRRALFIGTAVLALLGAALFWLLREPLARIVLEDSRMAASVGWLGVGVGLTVLAGSQIALLTGLRRLRDVAMVAVLSAVLGSIVGTGAIVALGVAGVPLFVIAMPAAAVLVGAAYVRRVPRARGPVPDARQLAAQWRALAKLGAAFAAASLLTLGAQLAVRIFIQRRLGIEALGLFQASWAIAMTYVTFVLQAMATDYYPRLTSIITDKVAASRLVNDQTEVALFLGGPVLLAIVATAPWIVQLLYSSQFTGAASLLRWQVVSDVAKLASWPLGFVLMASGRGRTFMLTEATGAAVLAGGTWAALPLFGLEAAGIAYLASYLVYLGVVYVLAARNIGFAWTPRVFRLVLFLAIAAGLTMALASAWPLVGGALGIVFAAGFAAAGLVVMRDSLPRPLAELVGSLSRKAL